MPGPYKGWFGGFRKCGFFIIWLTAKDAKRIGLSKMQMFRLKKKIKEGKKIVFKEDLAM